MQRIQTSDQIQTAYLLAKGYQLVSCQVEVIPHVTFTLKGQSIIEDCEVFLDRKGSTEPLAFQEKLEEVQSSLNEALHRFEKKHHQKRMERKEETK